MSSIATAHSPARAMDSARVRGFVVGLVTPLLAAALAAVAVAAAVGLSNEGRVLPGVRLSGIELGGLDRAQAEARLRAALPPLIGGTTTLVVDGEELTVRVADLGRAYDFAAMADAAYQTGRAENPVALVAARLRDALSGTALAMQVTPYDPKAMDRLIVSVAAAHARKPVDATITASGGSFVVTPAQVGTRLDPRVVRQLLGAALMNRSTADQRVEIPIVARQPMITTAEAEAAAATANAVTAAPLRLTADGDVFTLTPPQLSKLISFSRATGAYAANIDQAAVSQAVLGLAKQVNRPARSATYRWGARLEVVPSLTGRQLDAKTTAGLVSSALQARSDGTAPAALIQLPVSVTQPKLTTAAAQATIGNIIRVGTWTTYYFPGVSNGFGANISIPAQALDGKVVAPGANFDFWRDIGPITVERGYRYGGAIINGRSEPTGAFAGGICSASTTMFNAALRAGLQMGERWNHYYYISRYPVGLDATVFADGGRVWSMGFTNDTPYPIIIRSFTSYGVVTFSVYSVPNGRSVSFTSPIITNQVAAYDTVQYTSALPRGVQQRIEGVYNGFDAQVTRYVRDASGAVIHVDTFYSHYHPVNGVVLIGS